MNVLQRVIQETPTLKGTFIEELFEVMRNGQFVSPNGPVANGERIVGEMNELEKALYYLHCKYGEIANRIRSHFLEEGELISAEERFALETQFACYRRRFEIATKLMWDSIETRLADQDSQLSTAWGVRSNGQIVLMFGDQSRNPHEEMLNLFLSKMMSD